MANIHSHSFRYSIPFIAIATLIELGAGPGTFRLSGPEMKGFTTTKMQRAFASMQIEDAEGDSTRARLVTSPRDGTVDNFSALLGAGPQEAPDSKRRASSPLRETSPGVIQEMLAEEVPAFSSVHKIFDDFSGLSRAGIRKAFAEKNRASSLPPEMAHIVIEQKIVPNQAPTNSQTDLPHPVLVKQEAPSYTHSESPQSVPMTETDISQTTAGYSERHEKTDLSSAVYHEHSSHADTNKDFSDQEDPQVQQQEVTGASSRQADADPANDVAVESIEISQTRAATEQEVEDSIHAAAAELIQNFFDAENEDAKNEEITSEDTMILTPDESPCLSGDFLLETPSHGEVPVLFNFFEADKVTEMWEGMSKSTSLDATPEDLSALIELTFAEARKNNRDFMISLEREGRGVHMQANLDFSEDGTVADDRTMYCNRNHRGEVRWEKVRDLLTAGELEMGGFAIKVSVTIKVIELPIQKVEAPSTDDDEPWMLHRIGHAFVTKDPKDLQSHHMAMRVGFFARYQRSDPVSSLHYVRCYERSINGTMIRCSEPWKPTSNIADVVRAPRYTGVGAHRSALRNAVLRTCRLNAAMCKEEEDIPLPPPRMSFNPYRPVNGQLTPTGGDIHLAIRIVNRLLEPKFATVALPADVRITVSTGKNSREAVENALIQGLWELAEQQLPGWAKPETPRDSTDRLWLLFDEADGLAGLFTFGFWVLPQGGDEEKKLYRWEKGSLLPFLDPVVVKETGVRTLYVEAHLLPYKE